VINYPEKRRSGDPKRHPQVFHNQRETKPSPNPQIEIITTGRMKRTTHSSTLLIPCP
jgi:hypothetical protein